MKETDAAWLAGYIDGDGCITISGRMAQPVLHIDSCDMELLERVVSLCGGFIVTKKKYKDHHRQAYTWRVKGSTRIADILIEVRPYMSCKFKIERADILIHEWRGVVHRNGNYTAKTQAIRDEVRQRFMDVGAGRGKRMHISCVRPDVS